jgi:hypothetical protein
MIQSYPILSYPLKDQTGVYILSSFFNAFHLLDISHLHTIPISYTHFTYE